MVRGIAGNETRAIAKRNRRARHFKRGMRKLGNVSRRLALVVQTRERNGVVQHFLYARDDQVLSFQLSAFSYFAPYLTKSIRRVSVNASVVSV